MEKNSVYDDDIMNNLSGFPTRLLVYDIIHNMYYTDTTFIHGLFLLSREIKHERNNKAKMRNERNTRNLCPNRSSRPVAMRALRET